MATESLAQKAYPCTPIMYFQTGEHERIGRNLAIIGNKILTLPNGARLKFSDIIALAGDFYGIPDEPIAYPLGNQSVTLQRFKNAYSTLANTPYKGKFKKQLDKLVEMIREETDGRRNHHTDREWDEATGGFWITNKKPVIPGQMLKLARKNFDHFGSWAKIAYQTGHEYAIKIAREAGRWSGGNGDMLRDMAYSIEAFALHFFTDLFASGHIRTPRVELHMKVTPGIVGDLLSKYMHDEDNKFGLRVTNIRGDKWIAYGDGMLLKSKDEDNFNLVVEATQKSVGQVVKAYENPDIQLDPSAVTDLLPFVDEKEKNNTPLFQVKGGKIYRRLDINYLQGKDITTDWRGIPTARKLEHYKPKNPAIPI